jgi:hypothetical protein
MSASFGSPFLGFIIIARFFPEGVAEDGLEGPATKARRHKDAQKNLVNLRVLVP